jgi:hypothetical protein
LVDRHPNQSSVLLCIRVSCAPAPSPRASLVSQRRPWRIQFHSGNFWFRQAELRRYVKHHVYVYRLVLLSWLMHLITLGLAAMLLLLYSFFFPCSFCRHHGLFSVELVVPLSLLPLLFDLLCSQLLHPSSFASFLDRTGTITAVLLSLVPWLSCWDHPRFLQLQLRSSTRKPLPVSAGETVLLFVR